MPHVATNVDLRFWDRAEIMVLTSDLPSDGQSEPDEEHSDKQTATSYTPR